MSVRAIEGMQPFQDSVFNDCSYQVRFTVLRFYGRPLEPLVFNEEYRFKCEYEPEARRWYLVYTTHPIEDVDRVMTRELGIDVDARPQSKDVIRDLEKAIAEERPVMLLMDRFYQSGVPEYFHRQHFLHHMLVYGYDSARRIFHIFDDMHERYSEAIEACVLPYDEAEQGHAACYALFGKELGGRAGFTTFTAEANWRGDAAIRMRARDWFVSHLMNDRAEIEASVDELERFAAHTEAALAENVSADLLLDYYHMSRRMAEMKRTQLYQFRCMSEQCEGASVLADAIEAIARAWNLLRMRMMKPGGSARHGMAGELAADVSARLREIVRMEREQTIALFGFLEALNGSVMASVPATTHESMGATDLGLPL